MAGLPTSVWQRGGPIFLSRPLVFAHNPPVIILLPPLLRVRRIVRHRHPVALGQRYLIVFLRLELISGRAFVSRHDELQYALVTDSNVSEQGKLV